MNDRTLLELLKDRVAENPNDLWLRDLGVSGHTDWTWQDAYSEIQAVASWLRQSLGASGHKASILSRNRAHWVLADMAILASGNISVPMFTTQSSAIAEYIFDFTEVKVLFVGEAENWDTVRHVIPEGMLVVTFPGVDIEEPALKWQDLVDLFAGRDVDHLCAPNELVSIIFTSGTTGMPKGVMQSHVSMIIPVARSAKMLGLEDDPRLISYLPLSHIAERQAIEVHSLVKGGSISFIEAMPTIVRDLQRTNPTFFFAAPRVWEALQQGLYKFFGGRETFERSLAEDQIATAAKARAFLGFQRIDKALSGAAPLSTSLLEFYDDLGIAIIEAFGQTEAMSVIGNPVEDRRLGSIGKPIGDVEARISEDGELLIRASGMAIGYYKQPDQTAETFVEGWLHTGDRARVDEDGFYYLTGRVKDYFKTIHGKYVAPSQLEDPFSQSPYVDQICLIGRGCSKTAMICVLSEEGKTMPGDELAQALRETASHANDLASEKHTRIGVVMIARDPWTIENGCLTTTLKIKRAAIDDLYLDAVRPLTLRSAEEKMIIVEWEV